MSKTDYLLRLFRAHVANLNEVYPGIGDIIACPICLQEFTKEDIYNENLTDGHIWPTDMRKKSVRANDQGVLLCAEWNHTAGKRGDAQMQLLQTIKEESEKGDMHGIRTIEFIEHPGEKPIRMRVRIHQDDPTSINITGRINGQNQWLGSSPEDQARFEQLANRSMENQQQFGVTVYPFRGYNHNLAGVGWITSAYLMAFYALGYRYILNPELDFIRDYITRSFDPDQESNLVLPEHDSFRLGSYDMVEFPDPALRLAIPVGRDENVHLEVRFLEYEVVLPISLEPRFYKAWLSKGISQLQEQRIPPPADGALPTLYSRIDCTKTIEHTCFCDYLLGKPLPTRKV